MFEIDKRQFGMFLSQLRKEKGLTQRYLASELYISDKAVSKWETGQSLPDITLLKPLADLLGVTVTELLECRRMESEEPLDRTQVEDLLQKAAGFADFGPTRAQPKGKRLAIYLTCVLIAAVELGILDCLQVPFSENLMTAILFPVVFGAYFWLFVQTRLPGYYDTHRISNWSDGPLRMNIPGVTISNRNWPHIVKAMRIWSALTMTLFPLVYLAGALLLPVLWPRMQLYVFLAAVLGGMFIPLVVVGRKYQ